MFNIPSLEESFISNNSFISSKFVLNKLTRGMEELRNIRRPSKEEQATAFESYNALEAVLKELKNKSPEIEIEETHDKIRVPLKALKLLAKILKAMGDGKPISLVPVAAEMTTQSAAEFLGCSRPHFVKLLEEGKIPFTKIGKHRRVKFEDVSHYKDQMKKEQENLIIQMMKSDEESGLYDS